MHPADRLRQTKSDALRGKRIVLAVSGSIAAVEAVKIAHELIRHGADVWPVLSRAGATIITPLALEYATGHRAVVELTGAGEHIAHFGPRGKTADLLLVAPATANTIAKIALGIDDTPVTTFATVALGAGIPVVVAPAMHEVMGENPAVRERLQELVRAGVQVLEPRIEEEKAKIADPETIADAVIHRLARGPWVGRRVLVVSGSAAEPVDPVRVLTNRSSGRMGVELARAAYHAGADVELWNAWGLVPLPAFAKVRRFESVDDLRRLVKKTELKSLDAIFMPAALSDFTAVPAKHKISSEHAAVEIKLRALPKVLPEIRKKAPRAVLVGFKVESEAPKLLERARDRLLSNKADLFIANTSDALGATQTEAWVVRASGKPKRIKGSKARLANAVLAEAGRELRGSPA